MRRETKRADYSERNPYKLVGILHSKKCHQNTYTQLNNRLVWSAAKLISESHCGKEVNGVLDTSDAL